MPELILLRGYSGSGKTTYAKRHIEGNPEFVRVNRDDERRALTGRSDKFVGDHQFEELVTSNTRDKIRNAIRSGRSVIVDDTNLRLKYARELLAFGRSLGAEVDVMNIRTPLAECLARNAARLDGVDPEVIRTQARKWPIERWEPILLPVLEKTALEQYVPDTSLPLAVTVDLDGTWAEHNGRNPYDESRYHEDTPSQVVTNVVEALYEAGYKVIVLTGRKEKNRYVCESWLERHELPYHEMYMRADDDGRKDNLVKVDMFREHIAPRFHHMLHIDDRLRVIHALRDIGVTVWQVQDEDY
jgi:predicted kinase